MTTINQNTVISEHQRKQAVSGTRPERPLLPRRQRGETDGVDLIPTQNQTTMKTKQTKSTFKHDNVRALVMILGLSLFSTIIHSQEVIVIHNFNASTSANEINPQAGVIPADDGYLYGTTTIGGTSGHGTIFRLKPDGSEYAVLASFHGQNNGGTPPGTATPTPQGAWPNTTLIQFSKDHKIYGTTQNGGQFDAALQTSGPTIGGVVFRFDPGTIDKNNPVAKVEVLAEFQGQGTISVNTQEGQTPHGNAPGPLVERKTDPSDNNVYGIAGNFVFALDTIHDTTLVSPVSVNAARKLVEDSQGNLYFASQFVSAPFFKIKFPGFNITTMPPPSDSADTFANPGDFGSLLTRTDGHGIAPGKGDQIFGFWFPGNRVPPSPDGAIYQYDPAGNSVKKILEFTGASPGQSPNIAGEGDGGLIETLDGSLWGTTFGNGAINPLVSGTIFQIKPDSASPSGWSGKTIFTFSKFSGPYPDMCQDKNTGNIYGTTFFGSQSGVDGGVVFRIQMPCPCNNQTTNPPSGGPIGTSDCDRLLANVNHLRDILAIAQTTHNNSLAASLATKLQAAEDAYYTQCGGSDCAVLFSRLQKLIAAQKQAEISRNMAAYTELTIAVQMAQSEYDKVCGPVFLPHGPAIPTH